VPAQLSITINTSTHTVLRRQSCSCYCCCCCCCCCIAADGSVLLSSGKTPNVNEAKRNESQHRSYIRRTAKAIIPIAQKYNASVADTLAVCAMAVTSSLAGASGKQAPNMLDLVPLRVGGYLSDVTLLCFVTWASRMAVTSSLTEASGKQAPNMLDQKTAHFLARPP
jgi:hypothetical protein